MDHGPPVVPDFFHHEIHGKEPLVSQFSPHRCQDFRLRRLPGQGEQGRRQGSQDEEGQKRLQQEQSFPFLHGPSSTQVTRVTPSSLPQVTRQVISFMDILSVPSDTV